MIFRALAHLLKDVLLVAIFIGLCGITIAGAVLPVNFPQQTVGTFQLTSFPSGLALYQSSNSQHFYSFSPLDDFFLSPTGERTALLSVQDFNDKHFTVNDQIPVWKKYLIDIQSYTQPIPMRYEITSTFHTLYEAEQHGSTITIRKITEIPETQHIVAIGNTIKVGNQDIIFDSNAQVYSQPAEADLASFNQRNDATLLASKIVKKTRIPSGKVIITRPDMNGFLVVKAQPNQELWYNPISLLIEVVEPFNRPTNGQIQSTFQVTVTSTLEEALQS